MLRAAIKAVPAVKFALGVGGIIAVIAIVAGFKIDFLFAAFGTVIMLVLMTVLVLFASLAGQHKDNFKTPMLVFTWFSLLLTMVTALALFFSVFADWPLELRKIIMAPVVQKPIEMQFPATAQPKDKPSHSVMLTWAASSSKAAGYNVYRSQTSGGNYAKVNTSLIQGLTYTDNVFEHGVTYYYVTRAVDAKGNESDNSNETIAIIP